MKKIKDLGEKEVILCTTIAECEAIAELLHKEEFTWCSGDSYLTDRPYKIGNKEIIKNFCFYPNDGEWCWLYYYKKRNYTIHNAKDFLPERPNQVSNEVKEELKDILKEWAEGKFQKGLNKIIRERLK